MANGEGAKTSSEGESFAGLRLGQYKGNTGAPTAGFWLEWMARLETGFAGLHSLELCEESPVYALEVHLRL